LVIKIIHLFLVLFLKRHHGFLIFVKHSDDHIFYKIYNLI
jgi:hypothetical protein